MILTAEATTDQATENLQRDVPTSHYRSRDDRREATLIYIVGERSIIGSRCRSARGRRSSPRRRSTVLETPECCEKYLGCRSKPRPRTDKTVGACREAGAVASAIRSHLLTTPRFSPLKKSERAPDSSRMARSNRPRIGRTQAVSWGWFAANVAGVVAVGRICG